MAIAGLRTPSPVRVLNARSDVRLKLVLRRVVLGVGECPCQVGGVDVASPGGEEARGDEQVEDVGQLLFGDPAHEGHLLLAFAAVGSVSRCVGSECEGGQTFVCAGVAGVSRAGVAQGPVGGPDPLAPFSVPGEHGRVQKPRLVAPESPNA